MSTSSTASGNLVNDSHLPQILTVQTVVLVLALICVCLRLYVRIRMTKSMGRDDWTMAGAAVSDCLIKLPFFFLFWKGKVWRKGLLKPF